MKIDPIEIAKEIGIAYATDFIGDHNVLFTNILNRYGKPNQSLKEKLSNLVKIKGPYIQALPIPEWSNQTWIEFARSVKSEITPSGIDKNITRLFGRRIKKLYLFQEKAIKAILDDKNTLVVAGTGRGKTESWLIPIFQFILKAKRGEIPAHPPNSVKAILVYPTKALTQDQLKRLIKYLFEFNKHLPTEERISIGVYDGDTPSLQDQAHMAYLVNAFKYFKCPMFDSSKVLCRACQASNNCSLKVVKNEKQNPELRVPEPQCQKKIPLDFIRLTRNQIKEEKVDILLTNPDIINYRLVNINADIERKVFIQETKYLVLDEVHTFSGIFGAFVSLIIRRYKIVRKHLLRGETDDLRIIAASATVSNKSEIFGKITGVSEKYAVIEEEHTNIKQELPSKIPDFWLKNSMSKEDLTAEIRKIIQEKSSKEPFLSINKILNIDSVQFNQIDNDEDVEEYIGNRLFESITERIDETPELDVIRGLHTELLSKARLPDELVQLILERYSNLTKSEARQLVDNFFTIGELSGILENRIHLFAWPVDGYYACINCGAIYENARSECDKCHHHFITRITTCRTCEEEAYESWFCPNCLKIYPLVSNVEGRSTFFDVLKCNCTGEDTECLRVVWRPYYRCKNCGKITKKSFLEYCKKCNSRMLFDETGTKVICSNPNCTGSHNPQPAKVCSFCKSELELVLNQSYECPNCGKIYPEKGKVCDCGSEMHPILYLPWVCSNENCSEVYNSKKPPTQCKCGSEKFYLAGIFDINHLYRCNECNKEFVIDSCEYPNHILEERIGYYKDYRLIDQNFEICQVTESHKVPPCYHKRLRYTRKRYMSLSRSPENVVVTSAQHSLRKLIDNADLEDLSDHLRIAKILSFSDSRNDMERLTRSFQEPEQKWLMDQLLITVLEKSESNLEELYKKVQNELDSIQELYKKNQRSYLDIYKRLVPRYKQRFYNKEKLIKEQVDNRISTGYSPKGWVYDHPVRRGIIDVSLDLKEISPLTREEKILLLKLFLNRSISVGKLVEYLNPRMKGISIDQIIHQLKLKNLIKEEKGRLEINPEKIICTLVSKEHPTYWNPKKNTFVPTILYQLDKKIPSCICFNKRYTERTDLFKSGFSKLAYKLDYSSPVMLISETYKGNTEKTKRRRLEFQFKNEISPNFLSSGPAMELGIDIGDLDLLCLFGTPPNINSYLQRIGRAGRATKKSLVFSVSKRNPIDYYYYRNPLELIQSNPQPVPLNEHNPEILKVSLAWALLDYIATKFWVPWKKDVRPDGIRITDGEEFLRKESDKSKPEEILQLTRVYYSPNNEIAFGKRLEILQKILRDYRQEARSWLEELLDYNYCSSCGKRYPNIYEGKCQTPNCSGKVKNAKNQFADMIEDTLNSFGQHFVYLGKVFREDLKRQKRELRDELNEIEDKEDEIEEEEEIQRNILRKNSVEERLYQLIVLEKEVQKMKYGDFHRKTVENKYAFDIRNFEDEIDIITYKEEKDSGRFTPIMDTRGIQMAIKESHPYSVKIENRQKWVTCRILFDTWKREEIEKVFPDQLICSHCFKIYNDLGKVKCECGGNLKKLETHSPRRIEVFPADYPLRRNVETGIGQLNPLDLHRQKGVGNTVKSTIPNSENKVTDFDPSCRWDIKNDNGDIICNLEYGYLHVATVVDSSINIYENGLVDRLPHYFELCGVEDCNSVVNQNGNHLCCRNSTHKPDQKKFVRLATIFPTFGVRIKTDDPIVTHTIAHGLRVGLQNIAGVQIRNIGETVEENYVYVYDTEPGGSGVTALLTSLEENDYKNFKHAIELFRKHLAACKCEDGCPHCVYQYGCALKNDPRQLSRRKTLQWMANGVNIVEKQVS